MSADAKCWQVDDDSYIWAGICDSQPDHRYRWFGLKEAITELERLENKGNTMRWELARYPEGLLGIRGYCV